MRAVLAGALTAADLVVLETGALTGDVTVSGFLRSGVLATLPGVGAAVDFFRAPERGLFLVRVLVGVSTGEDTFEALCVKFMVVKTQKITVHTVYTVVMDLTRPWRDAIFARRSHSNTTRCKVYSMVQITETCKVQSVFCQAAFSSRNKCAD